MLPPRHAEVRVLCHVICLSFTSVCCVGFRLFMTRRWLVNAVTLLKAYNSHCLILKKISSVDVSVKVY